MEMVLFSGIQAAGKSTFFKERFVDTHLRINLFDVWGADGAFTIREANHA